MHFSIGLALGTIPVGCNLVSWLCIFRMEGDMGEDEYRILSHT